MCNPLAAMAVQTAGNVYGAIQQSQTANANAKVIRNQQIARRQQADFDEGRALDQRSRVLSSQTAGFAASGVGGGVVSEVAADTTVESALDIAAIQYNADVDINNLEARRLEQKRKGRDALVSGAIGAISPQFSKGQNATFLRGPFAKGAT